MLYRFQRVKSRAVAPSSTRPGIVVPTFNVTAPTRIVYVVLLAIYLSQAYQVGQPARVRGSRRIPSTAAAATAHRVSRERSLPGNAIGRRVGS
jgi:hypothetical protein